MNRIYVIIADGQEHEIPAFAIVYWLLGYLTRMATESLATSAVAKAIADQLRARPSESYDQFCYRSLLICHDQQIVTYRGIKGGIKEGTP